MRDRDEVETRDVDIGRKCTPTDTQLFRCDSVMCGGGGTQEWMDDEARGTEASPRG